jgi:uncharacterized protein
MREVLDGILRQIACPAIAVSGGVDSVTLAAVALEVASDVVLMHAVSPAVPPEATRRLQDLAIARGWNLQILSAGEFADLRYRENPVNRCFYCKSNLYGAMAARTDRQILSGANLDDLGEYRPGLIAAQEHHVRHPYIEARITKSMIRAIARDLRLHQVSELPASPCLSSRVETGIRIEASLLSFIHAVESAISAHIKAATVRCRVRAAAVVIELDTVTMDRLSPAEQQRVIELTLAQSHRPQLPVLLERYRRGSAFVTGS